MDSEFISSVTFIFRGRPRPRFLFFGISLVVSESATADCSGTNSIDSTTEDVTTSVVSFPALGDISSPLWRFEPRRPRFKRFGLPLLSIKPSFRTGASSISASPEVVVWASSLAS